MPQSFSPREQKIVVKYLKAQNTHNEEIHKLLTSAAGPSTVSYKEAKQWVKDIDEGKEETDICTCSLAANGQLDKASPTDPALICRVECLINSDRRINLDKAAELSNSSDFAVNQIFSSTFTVRRVCERWIPRSWTPDQRTYRVSVCKELQSMYQYGADDFLSRLIVGDECFAVYHATDPSRRPSTATGPGTGAISISDKYKPVKDQALVNCMFFYDMKGLLLAELMPEDETPTPHYYATLLKNNLLPILKRKRSHTMGDPIYILHDNTALHDSLPFQEMQKELNIKRLPHPPNSPDMEPQEYWFFKQMKKLLSTASFKSRADIETTINKHTKSFTDADYANSIAQLPGRWQRIIENDGLYILN